MLLICRHSCTAVFSALILALSISTYGTFFTAHDPPFHTIPFWEGTLLYFAFSLPVFLVLGVPISLLLNWLIKVTSLKKRIMDYLYSVAVYALAGMVANFFWLYMLSEGDWSLNGIDYLGASAAVLYLHVFLIQNRIKRPAICS